MSQARECYLCGKLAATRDHVPPKTFFPDPRPSNLITVPCCQDCNKAYSKDEEYFRTNVAMLSNPQYAGEAWKAARRSLKRRPKLMAETLRRISAAQVGNVVLPVVRYDAKRTNRVLVKIALGLLYHHTGRKLPDSVRKDAFPADVVPQAIKDLIPKLPFRGRWPSTFAYAGGMATDEPNTGIWLLSFYLSRSYLVEFDTSPLRED